MSFFAKAKPGETAVPDELTVRGPRETNSFTWSRGHVELCSTWNFGKLR